MSRGAGVAKSSTRKIKFSPLDWRTWIGITFILIIISGSLMVIGIANVLEQTKRGTEAALESSRDAKAAAKEAAELTALAKQLTDPNSVSNREAIRQRQELTSAINRAIERMNVLAEEHEEFKEEIKATLEEVRLLLNNL